MSDHSNLSKSRTPTPELGDSTENLVETTIQNFQNPNELPSTVPRTSLPVRFANSDFPNFEKPLLDISSTLFCAQLKDTNNLFRNVDQAIRGVDKVLTSANHSLITNLLDQTIVGTDMSVNCENTQSPNGTQIPQGDSLSQGVRNSEPHDSQQEVTAAENYGVIRNGEAGYTPVRAIEPSDTIGLEAALRSSFNGEQQEDTEVFLEKCEFAISCASETARARLLQGIIVRLTEKARQAVKFRSFSSWHELREALKTALEPQRTTTHLFLELYHSQQKYGEDVMAYSTRIEQLYNSILEQETSG